MLHLEQLAESMARMEASQEKSLEMLLEIKVETTKTNGRVTALEKDNSRLWGFVKWGFVVGGVVLLILVAKGIVSPTDIPHP